MFLTGTVSADLPLLDASVIAVLGYAVVFFGLILLLGVVAAMGRYFVSKENKAPKTAAPAASAPAAPVTQDAPTAPGTAGKLKLYDTPPKTAAMIMAIVADKLGKPLNELRFISIREVKE